MENDIPIGTYETHPTLDFSTNFICESRDLKPHIEKPWFQAWAAERLGVPLTDTSINAGLSMPGKETAFIPDQLAARHIVIGGSTGSGKSKSCGIIAASAMQGSFVAV